MKIIAVWFIICLHTYNLALPADNLFGLDIIHYNDFHARFEETSVHYPTCRFNNGSCLGGFPRLYKEINILLKEKPDSLLLNAGDSFQGTYWYTLLKWNITQEFMNLLPHDAHAIGNHEFDDGPEGLAPYLSHLKAPVVAANMDVSKEPVLQGLFQKSIVVERKGRKIGIIGLVTPETAKLSSAGNVVFTDPGEATDREALALTEKGVDIIILLSHCGLDVDKQLARDHGQYIDIIIGGHTHSLLWKDNNAPSKEPVAGPYPIFLKADKTEHQVMIVQASAFTKYMGNLTVYFDFRGDYVKMEGGPIFLDRSIPEDEEIKNKLKPYALKVHEAENVPVGETTTTMLMDDCVFGECTLGNLLTDSINEKAKKAVKSSHPYLAFMQRSEIKSSIAKGAITIGNIYELQPYVGQLRTFPLQGKYVLKALERSVIEAWSQKYPFRGPWVLQVSGLRVTYNVSLPEKHRVVSTYIGEIDFSTPLDSEAFYQVTMSSFLSGGGNGFKAKKVVNSDYPYLAFMQRGNIKSSIAEGVITQSTIFELQPYVDRVKSFELQGKYVLKALERSVVEAWSQGPPFKGPWILQVSGLRVTYNVSLPENHRVISVFIGGIDSTTPLDSEAFYQVSAPSYLSDGGDGFTMFMEGARNVQIIGRDQPVLIDYIQKYSPLHITTDGRIKILY